MDGAYLYWKERLHVTEEERFYDVDYSLTTRELARMFREAGIAFAQLPEEAFDNPLGESTGAAVIFGSTGGVMEAALRTAYELYTGEKLGNVDFQSVRGLQGIKEADVNLNGTILKVAVANTLKNAGLLLDQIKTAPLPTASSR